MHANAVPETPTLIFPKWYLALLPNPNHRLLSLKKEKQQHKESCTRMVRYESTQQQPSG
jgi:hypothetical protein